MSQTEEIKKWTGIIEKIIANPKGTYCYPKDGKEYKLEYTIKDYPEYGKREITIECKELNLQRFVTIKAD